MGYAWFGIACTKASVECSDTAHMADVSNGGKVYTADTLEFDSINGKNTNNTSDVRFTKNNSK